MVLALPLVVLVRLAALVARGVEVAEAVGAVRFLLDVVVVGGTWVVDRRVERRAILLLWDWGGGGGGGGGSDGEELEVVVRFADVSGGEEEDRL